MLAVVTQAVGQVLGCREMGDGRPVLARSGAQDGGEQEQRSARRSPRRSRAHTASAHRFIRQLDFSILASSIAFIGGSWASVTRILLPLPLHEKPVD
jgi:hypothetical protein